MLTYLLIQMKNKTTILLLSLSCLLLCNCQSPLPGPRTALKKSTPTTRLPSWTKQPIGSIRTVAIACKIIELSRESRVGEIPQESFQKLMNEAQSQIFLRAILQRKGADLMTSRSVVAKDGQTTKISLIRKFCYPSPENFEETKSEETGVIQYFRARSVEKGGEFKFDSLINIREFEEFYQTLNGQQEPIFRNLRVDESVSLSSGESVVFGGYSVGRLGIYQTFDSGLKTGTNCSDYAHRSGPRRARTGVFEIVLEGKRNEAF